MSIINYNKLLICEYRHAKKVNLISDKVGGDWLKNPIKCALIIFIGIFYVVFFDSVQKSKIKYILVGFGNDQFAKRFKIIYKNSAYVYTNSIRALFMRNSLFPLDGYRFLIERRLFLPRAVRKMVERLFRDWINKFIKNHEGVTFIVKQDYYGASSMLTTISHQGVVNVIGVQHGLMDYGSIMAMSYYPGVRVLTELVYTESFRQISKKMKPPKSQTILFGPPFEIGDTTVLNKYPPTVIFISSDDLREVVKFNQIMQIKQMVTELGCEFYIRPHQSEKWNINIKKLKLINGKKSILFQFEKSETVFVGYFSTLLLELGLRGFRTVWLSDQMVPRSELDVLHNFRLADSTKLSIDSIVCQSYINEHVGPTWEELGYRIQKIFK